MAHRHESGIGRSGLRQPPLALGAGDLVGKPFETAEPLAQVPVGVDRLRPVGTPLLEHHRRDQRRDAGSVEPVEHSVVERQRHQQVTFVIDPRQSLPRRGERPPVEEPEVTEEVGHGLEPADDRRRPLVQLLGQPGDVTLEAGALAVRGQVVVAVRAVVDRM